MAEEHSGRRVIATNRKARHEYQILDSWEAGLVLTGPEVKSARAGHVSFKDTFARLDGGEVWLQNLHISPYDPASRWNLDPERPRKLLLHAHEIRKLIGRVEERGLSLVPLDLYFRGGYVKTTLALARGKKMHDKRETLKARVQEREARRAVKGDRSG
ncbi:MAG: SsrA-binding protein SmpB [Gemmatimonadetes bacterium]|nr:SsrA-binding protein SmpB [Gemmatimonadota bacterium]